MPGAPSWSSATLKPLKLLSGSVLDSGTRNLGLHATGVTAFFTFPEEEKRFVEMLLFYLNNIVSAWRALGFSRRPLETAVALQRCSDCKETSLLFVIFE